MEVKFSNPMRLPLPFRAGDKVIYSAEYESPSLGAIADTQKNASKSLYRAVKTWIDGGVTAYIDDQGARVDDPAEIKRVGFDMSIQSAETLAMAIALEYNEDDKVEGIYTCPLCGTELVAEYTPDQDTRDSISDLTINCADEPEDTVIITLDKPIKIGGKSRVTDEMVGIEIQKIELRHPTIRDGINGQGKYGASDETRQQFAYYIEALVSLNDEPVSSKDRNEFGMKVFENMRGKSDIKKLGEMISRYGVVNTIEKTCPKCLKRWKETINTSSFFASALQSGSTTGRA